MNKRNSTSPSIFESDVEALFLMNLSDGEKILFDEPIDTSNKGGFRFRADIYLPNGFSALKWNGKTYVEIKYAMTYNAFEHIKALRDQIPNDVHLVIITSDKLDISPLRNIPFRSRFNMERDLISYSELLEKLNIHEDQIDSTTNQPTINESSESLKNYEDSKSRIDISKNSITEAIKDFENGNVCLVLGAGVSQSVELPSWTSLLEAILNENPDNVLEKEDFPAIEVASFNSTIIMARLLLSQYDLHKNSEQLSRVVKIMHDALYKGYRTKKDSDLLKAIVTACNKKDADNMRIVSSIITTNYDNIVEQKLSEANIPYWQVVKEGKYKRGMLPIIHVHGSMNYNNIYPVLPTLSEESYHEMYRNGHSWANVEMLHAFYRNTCIFIGMSMSDPNIRRLLENVKSGNPNSIDHYAILPSKPLSNHNWDSAHPHKYYVSQEKKEADFRRRQEKVYADLGIKVLWYEDLQYSQVATLLNVITGEITLPEEHPLMKMNSL